MTEYGHMAIFGPMVSANIMAFLRRLRLYFDVMSVGLVLGDQEGSEEECERAG